LGAELDAELDAEPGCRTRVQNQGAEPGCRTRAQRQGAEAGIGRVGNRPHQFVVWRQQNVSEKA